MSFISVNFGIFLLLSIILYYIFPKKHQWKLLLVVSYIFYGFSGLTNLIYILLTTISCFLSAKIINKNNLISESQCSNSVCSKKEIKAIKSKTQKKNKKYLTFALLFNFSMLAFFKYFEYFVKVTLKIESIDLGILLPLGISFYIFQSTGYIIDVYRKKYEAENNFFKFALFVSYFPQLIQGPIGRYNKLSQQLFSGNCYNASNIKYGVQLAIWGLFKKLVISDRLGAIVNGVFANYSAYTGLLVFISLIFYGIQIYCDFSGGIDIARGVSQMFGIKMSINFRQPFFAHSLADFWRRWHITLGSWLKEYLFFPLNLSKPLVALNKKGRKILGAEKGKFISLSISTFIIYFIVGIWHGAGAKYIAFGIYNGVIITFSLLMEKSFNLIKEKVGVKNNYGFIVFQIVRTNLLVSIGRYFTRANGFRTALSMLKHTFFNFKLGEFNKLVFFEFGLKEVDFIVLTLGIGTLLIVDYFAEKNIDLRKVFEKRSFFLQFSTLLISLIVIIYFGIYSKGYISAEFIYKGF